METQSAFMAAAAAAVLLGAILLERRDARALLFAALTFSFGILCLGRGAQSLALGWADSLVGAAFGMLGPLSPLSAAALTGRLELERRLRAGVWLGLPALALGLGLPEIEAGGLRTLLGQALALWALAGVITGAAILVRFAPERTAEEGSDATRMRYLAIAHVIVALAASLDLVLGPFQGPRVASLLVPLLYLYAGYLHLAQVRVADLRQLMGNTVALTLMAIGLAGSFALIRIWVGERLDLFVFNSFVASFVLLLFFPTVRARIQHRMDRYFMAPKLELQRVLGALGERLTQIRTLDELLKDLLGTLEQIDRLRSCAVFLRDAPHLGFQQAGSIGLPPRARINLIRHPAWIEALERHGVLIYEELHKSAQEARGDERRASLESLCRTMRDLDAQLALGLRSDRGLVGFWTLSEADPREPFSSTEVDLLRSVADRIAVSIENSKTFERIRARDRMASLGEMATGLAHELRNPLATIRGALAVLADPGAEAREEFHEVVLQEIERVDRVVGTFLDYARPYARRAPVRELEELVRACVRSVAHQHRGEPIDVRVDVQSDLPPACADADQLERVVMNVLHNAYEALEGNGSIRVSVYSVARARGGTELEIAVRDDGPGMDERTLERAFVPFFTTKETGVGLGLALCEKLMRSQDGKISLQSKPGEGTTVRLRLPCWEGPEAGTDAEPSEVP